MQKLILICFLTLSISYGKAQCIRIYVSEQVKGVDIPVKRREFEITLNDTIKLNLISGNDGLLGRISLERGTYKVLIQNPEYANSLMDKVVVEESRSTNITMYVTPAAAVKEEDKKKAK